MATLTIELPGQAEQTAFNLRRWAELLDDPVLAEIEGRIETDRHGNIIRSPPPAPSHGQYQSMISHFLLIYLPKGATLSECPISTADGVRAADVAWASPEFMEAMGENVCFLKAPEICVEVLSPSNSDSEVREKMALYFDAGASEVWICDKRGSIRFFVRGEKEPRSSSEICPQFPDEIRLRLSTN
jgi:Uma2 family endonuclease